MPSAVKRNFELAPPIFYVAHFLPRPVRRLLKQVKLCLVRSGSCDQERLHLSNLSSPDSRTLFSTRTHPSRDWGRMEQGKLSKTDISCDSHGSRWGALLLLHIALRLASWSSRHRRSQFGSTYSILHAQDSVCFVYHTQYLFLLNSCCNTWIYSLFNFQQSK